MPGAVGSTCHSLSMMRKVNHVCTSEKWASKINLERDKERERDRETGKKRDKETERQRDRERQRIDIETQNITP